MSGRGRSCMTPTKAKSPTRAKSLRSARTGQKFPDGHVHRFHLKGKYAQRVGAGPPAAVLEYPTAEILQLAGNASRDNKTVKIIPKYLQLGVRDDEEPIKRLGGVTIA
ncbi:histone H2A-like [Diadema setosum]|uniref:histone H2A-like n=1 Tax=Diadema setosum TaxID=31175 RepID=UPI003B3B8391